MLDEEWDNQAMTNGKFIFYRKKVVKSDRLNDFIRIFATLIKK